jgi:hypothetical protein
MLWTKKHTQHMYAQQPHCINNETLAGVPSEQLAQMRSPVSVALLAWKVPGLQFETLRHTMSEVGVLSAICNCPGKHAIVMLRHCRSELSVLGTA